MLAYEDLNEYDGSADCGYPVCNERLDFWNEALHGITVDNAAGICSGGEVAFFALLPHVRKSLTLIDHAYTALYHAIGKYHAIEKLGSVSAVKLLKSCHTVRDQQFRDLCAEGNQGLPTKPLGLYDEGRGQMRAVWADISRADVVKFRRNRHKVSFLHGDLDDLAEKGPFDLVYLSNALDYSGRSGRPHKFKEMVKPGGYLLYTQGWRGTPRGLEGFKEVASKSRDKTPKYDRDGRRIPSRSMYGLSWHHVVCQASN